MNLTIWFVFLYIVDYKVQFVQSASRRQSSNQHSRGQKLGHGGHRGSTKAAPRSIHRAGPVALWSTKHQLRFITVEFA